VDFCALSDVTAIVHTSNQLRLFHLTDNGIQALPLLPVVKDFLVGGNSLIVIPFLAMNVDGPFTFNLSCNTISSIPPVSAFFRLFDVTGTRSGISPIHSLKHARAYHS
jgi:Leucine-rich repeat (LRR) protein